MNAFERRVSRLASNGRMACAAAHAALAQATLLGIAIAAGGSFAAAQEYVVGDLPETPVVEAAPAEDGAIVGLPEEPVIQADTPVFDAASEPVIPDEAGATGYTITDGWSPVGPLAPPTRHQIGRAHV